MTAIGLKVMGGMNGRLAFDAETFKTPARRDHVPESCRGFLFLAVTLRTAGRMACAPCRLGAIDTGRSETESWFFRLTGFKLA